MTLLQDQDRMDRFRSDSDEMRYCICPDKRCTKETKFPRTMIAHIKSKHRAHAGYALVLLPNVEADPNILLDPDKTAKLGSEARRIRLCPLCNEMVDKEDFAGHLAEIHDEEELNNEEMDAALKYVKEDPKRGKDHKLMGSLFKSVVLDGEPMPPVRLRVPVPRVEKVPLKDRPKRCPFCREVIKKSFKAHINRNHEFRSRRVSRKSKYLCRLDGLVLADEKLSAPLHYDIQKTYPEWKHLYATVVIAH